MPRKADGIGTVILRKNGRMLPERIACKENIVWMNLCHKEINPLQNMNAK